MLKLFEYSNGQLKTLFHGIPCETVVPASQLPRAASRTVPLGVWLTADEKLVSDGSNKTQYLSGFHGFFCDMGTIAKYCSRFTKPRELVLVDVCADGLRPKPTNPNVTLASRIYVPPGFQPIYVKEILK